MSRFVTASEEPRCQTKQGCPISNIAFDKDINVKAKNYLRVRGIMDYPHLVPYGHKMLEDEGIDDPELLLMCEKKVHEWREENRKKEERKQKFLNTKQGKRDGLV